MSAGPVMERLEQAMSGGDELDAHIRAAFLAPGSTVKQSPINGVWCLYNAAHRLVERPHRVPHELWLGSYTQSVDAALALAERVLPGWGAYMRSDKDGCGAGMTHPKHNFVTPGHQTAPTLPLALCKAILAAIADEARATTDSGQALRDDQNPFPNKDTSQ